MSVELRRRRMEWVRTHFHRDLDNHLHPHPDESTLCRGEGPAADDRPCRPCLEVALTMAERAVMR